MKLAIKPRVLRIVLRKMAEIFLNSQLQFVTMYSQDFSEIPGMFLALFLEFFGIPSYIY